MAKLTVLAAFLLVALLALGRASATRTTITTTTTVVEDDGSNRPGQCEMSMQQMKPCMMYLTDMWGGGSSTDPMPEQLKMCCSQLKSMDEQCRCESLEMMMMKQKEKGEFRGQKMQKMMHEAMMIPGKCDMSPQRCQFHMLSI